MYRHAHKHKHKHKLKNIKTKNWRMVQLAICSTCLSFMVGLAGRSSKYLLPVARRMSGGSAGSFNRPECGEAQGLDPARENSFDDGFKAWRGGLDEIVTCQQSGCVGTHVTLRSAA